MGIGNSTKVWEFPLILSLQFDVVRLHQAILHSDAKSTCELRWSRFPREMAPQPIPSVNCPQLKSPAGRARSGFPCSIEFDLWPKLSQNLTSAHLSGGSPACTCASSSRCFGTRSTGQREVLVLQSLQMGPGPGPTSEDSDLTAGEAQWALIQNDFGRSRFRMQRSFQQSGRGRYSPSSSEELLQSGGS